MRRKPSIVTSHHRQPKKAGDALFVTSQRQLAHELTRIFQGRIISTISRARVWNWCKGRLPRGVPLPPAPVNDCYDVQQYRVWFEANILPLPDWKFAGTIQNGEDESLVRKRAEIQMLADIAKAEDVIRVAEIRAGKWKPVELFNQHMASFFAEINAYIVEGERLIQKTFEEVITASEFDDAIKAKLAELVKAASQRACDMD